MRVYDPDLPLFSIHIPKCAGVSLRRVLQEWFGAKLYLHYIDQKKDEPPPRRELKAGVSWTRRKLAGKSYPERICLHGHFNHTANVGLLDYYPDARQCITFLRDPFEIAVSMYFFAKAKGNERFLRGERRPIRDEFVSLEDYVEREVLNKPSILANFMPFPLKPETLEQELNKWFVYVGITEDTEASIKQLSQRLGFSYMPMPRRNESRWDEPVPAGARDAYRLKHPVEQALYDYARAHYLD